MKRRQAFILGGLVLGGAALAARPAGAESFKTRQVRFPGAGGIELAGTLLLPMISELQKVPGAVLIAGSGPTDRDGNNPLIPTKIDLLKQIAELLAEAGIASIRYDKRGIGQSTKAPASLADRELFFAWENFIGDVQLAHAELVKQDEVKSYATALLGHSEGGLFAVAAAEASVPARAPYALVLAGTPGRPLQEIIRNQLSRNAPHLVAPAERIMDAIRRTRRVPPDVPADLASLFPPYIGPFLHGELGFDPAKTLLALKQPCLLLHGGADQQVVPMGEIQPLIDALERRSGPAEAIVAPLVSHNLKSVSGPGDPGFTGPIAPAIALNLRGWLASTLGA
jgi:alpha-beta hydrolase superfamily lysophospholipase